MQTDGGDPIFPHATPYFRNIRWSPNGEYAIITEKNSTLLIIYIFIKKRKSKVEIISIWCTLRSMEWK